MNENENIYIDCNRGCTISRDENDNLKYEYREGCCKLSDYNWLSSMPKNQFGQIFEVRFKNTRKDFYINNSGEELRVGDMVVVEAQSGYDVGIITLEGPTAVKQLMNKCLECNNCENPLSSQHSCCSVSISSGVCSTSYSTSSGTSSRYSSYSGSSSNDSSCSSSGGCCSSEGGSCCASSGGCSSDGGSCCSSGGCSPEGGSCCSSGGCGSSEGGCCATSGNQHSCCSASIDIDPYKYKKIYRKARSLDIEKWHEAVSKESSVMIMARKLAMQLGLDMKIGDVEFQGDGSKAIFYYIADTRVDFRQLIKVFAAEFHIRIEMRQIGARQEAGLIGGIGVCGRELCCTNHISSFKSISTSSARCQDLSLNPQKLAGQCGKLKCCLNYEVANYLDAQSKLPRINAPLQLEDGEVYLMKTDILAGVLYFSYEQNSLSKLYPLTIEQVCNIMDINKKGRKALSLKQDDKDAKPDFVSAVGDDSISRFDHLNNKKKSKNKNKKQKSQQAKEDV